MKFSRLIAIACLSLLLAGPTWAQEEEQAKHEKKEVCSHPKGWTPTADEMQRILADHAQWVRTWEVGKPPRFVRPERVTPEGRANLCNVKWREIKLEDSNLSGAQLNDADLRLAQLNNANLWRAQLNNADLSGAQLNNANLSGAELNNANLRRAQLSNAHLSRAQLNNADLRLAQLTPICCRLT